MQAMITSYRGIDIDCEASGTINTGGVQQTTIGQCKAYLDDKVIVGPLQNQFTDRHEAGGVLGGKYFGNSWRQGLVDATWGVYTYV